MTKSSTVTRICKHHGETEFVLEQRAAKSAYRCRKCRGEHVSNMRRNLRIELVNLAGGKCAECGYSKCIAALHFHHTEDDKTDAVSILIRNGRRKAAREEAKKCVLLCANCHAEHHASLT